jgi:hypothetical protein
MGFENFAKGGEWESLCSDVSAQTTMFRIVVKSNLTFSLAQYLVEALSEALHLLDVMEDKYARMRLARARIHDTHQQMKTQEGLSFSELARAVVAAEKFSGKWRKSMKEDMDETRTSLNRRRKVVPC